VREWMCIPMYSCPASIWRCVVSFTPLPLYLQGKNPRYPSDRRLGVPRTGLDDVERGGIVLIPGLELRPPRPSSR
jgi:hypothetical protein